MPWTARPPKRLPARPIYLPGARGWGAQTTATVPLSHPTPGPSALEDDLQALVAADASFRAAASGQQLGTVFGLIAAARSQGYRWTGVRMLAALVEAVLGSSRIAPEAAIEHLLDSGRSAESSAKVLSQMRTTADLFAPAAAALLRHPMVGAALEGARRLEGPVSIVRGAVPLTPELYRELRGASRGEMTPTVVLMWCAAMRHADVRALRVGGIWAEGPALVVEVPVSKTQQVGLPRGIRIMPPSLERLLLQPWTARAAPTSRAFERPPLLHVTYDDVSGFVKRVVGEEYTPHSFRKGAVQQLLSRGVPLEDIPLLTLHRSMAGLMAYAAAPDARALQAIQRMSEALHG